MKKTIIWIIILGVVGGFGYKYWNTKQAAVEASKPSFDREKAELRDLSTTVDSTGEVQPRNRLDVKPPIAGRLEELMVDEGDKVEKGQILGWISSTERATLLDAALATSEDELEYWQELYKPSPLISPLEGTIIARNFEPGQSIGASDVVVVIADDLIIVANLDETDIGQVKTDQVVKSALEAYPDREFDCVVEKIAYDAKTVSNVTMYEVDVSPKRIPPFARSGMTANLTFVVEEKEGALTVSASAVQQKSSAKAGEERPNFEEMSEGERKKFIMERMRERGLSESEIQERLERFGQGGSRRGDGPDGGQGGGSRKPGVKTEYYVFVDSGDPENPKQVAVKIGMSDGSHTEITEGLSEGEEVLIPRVNLGSGSKGGGSSLFMSTPGGGPRR